MSTGTIQPASEVFAEPRPIEALGDLFANLWQVCYVTPDLDRGMKELHYLFGIENATEVPTEGASPSPARSSSTGASSRGTTAPCSASTTWRCWSRLGTRSGAPWKSW